MDWMDKDGFLFVLIVYFYLVAESSFSYYYPGQAVEAGEKLPGLHTGIDLKIDLVAFLEFLKVLA